MNKRIVRPILANARSQSRHTNSRLSPRRVSSLLAATVVAAGFSLTTSPAHASATITISGSNGNYSVSPSSLTLANGLIENITITNSSDINVRFFGESLNPTTLQVSFDSGNSYWTCFTSTACLINAGQSLPALVERQAAQTPKITFQQGNGVNDPVLAEVTLTGTNGSGQDVSATIDVNNGPASIVQQFGLPTSGNCEDINDDAFKWGTGLSGGWGESWAQWMNEGAGGAVCTRTIEWRPGNGWRLAR